MTAEQIKTTVAALLVLGSFLTIAIHSRPPVDELEQEYVEAINDSIDYEPTDEQLVALETIFSAVGADDLYCLALNIYHEARGESAQGKLGVAFVTMNRVKEKGWKDTVCGVVFEGKYAKNHRGEMVPIKNKCHFSWVCDGLSDEIKLVTYKGEPIRKNIDAWRDSNLIALMVLMDKMFDPTDGATHHFNPQKADPWWKPHYTKVADIDNHVFYR